MWNAYVSSSKFTSTYKVVLLSICTFLDVKILLFTGGSTYEFWGSPITQILPKKTLPMLYIILKMSSLLLGR